MQLKGFLANGTVFHFGCTTGAWDVVEGGKDKDKNAQRIKEFFLDVQSSCCRGCKWESPKSGPSSSLVPCSLTASMQLTP